ncbi:hypothetical protein GCM10010286_64240 [Streptomyces toxytricini]|nr:hypothetical protein GCM10010286_64240 [Streptomyces toxytricini]
MPGFPEPGAAVGAADFGWSKAAGCGNYHGGAPGATEWAHKAGASSPGVVRAGLSIRGPG